MVFHLGAEEDIVAEHDGDEEKDDEDDDDIDNEKEEEEEDNDDANPGKCIVCFYNIFLNLCYKIRKTCSDGWSHFSARP